MSKVNIFVCTKDRAGLIDVMADALLHQTFDDYKILTCDDHSSDISQEKLYNLQMKTNGKLVSWVMEKEEGYVNTHNFILSKIDDDCEYFCFVDSDDIVDEHKIEKQVEYLESHPDVDVVSSCVAFTDKRVLVNTYVELNNDQVTEGLKKDMPITIITHFQTCMFRRRVLDKFVNGKYFYDEYDTGMCGEGFLYTLHFLGYKFANIPSTIYLYRRGIAKNSMSNNIVPEFANAINSLSYENKREYIMELFNKYNGKPIKKTTSKKKVEKKEEDENTKVEVLDEVKVEEPVVEEAPKKKRGRPKKTQE